MIFAWVLAGVMAELMNASGFVETLVTTASAAGVSGGLFVATAFLICCAVSTATGTSWVCTCGAMTSTRARRREVAAIKRDVCDRTARVAVSIRRRTSRSRVPSPVRCSQSMISR